MFLWNAHAFSSQFYVEVCQFSKATVIEIVHIMLGLTHYNAILILYMARMLNPESQH